MADENKKRTAKSTVTVDKSTVDKSTAEEFYSISVENAQQEYVQVRRAAQGVPFFLPHLKSEMSVLDCGCGVGSITLDLAEIVAPGQVIGIDRDPSHFAVARAQAEEKGITNIEFRVGNAYELEFSDG